MIEQVFNAEQEAQCPECGEFDDLCFNETTLCWRCEDCWDKEMNKLKSEEVLK